MPEDTYEDEAYCPFCGRETVQRFHDAGHERDSSYDSRECLTCGAMAMGLDGFRAYRRVSADRRHAEERRVP